MEEYNHLIASHLLDNVERGILKSTPQPTMFGGKRMRKFVLPASTDYDYPGTLSVGSLDGSRADTLGGSFWKDFGHGFKQGFTGTLKAVAPIVAPLAKEALLAKMAGAGYESESDYDSECEEMEGGFIVGEAGHGILRMPAEVGVSRAEGGGRDPVRDAMKSIGSVINPALLVGLGKPSASEKALAFSNPLLWGYDLGHDVIAPALMGKKKGRGRLPKGSPEAKAHMAELRKIRDAKMAGGAYVPTGKSKPAGYIRRLVAEQTKAPPFEIELVGEPSENLKAYAKANRVKKPRGRPSKSATPEEAKERKKKADRERIAKKRKEAKMALAPPEPNEPPEPDDEPPKGGALIMNRPAEFHSSHYPKALASYNPPKRGGKGVFGDIVKAVAPIAKDVAKEAIKQKMRGGKGFLGDVVKAVAPIAKDVAKEAIKQKMRGGARSARNEIVKKIMKEKGLSLPMASKYVKEHGLY